MAARSVSYDFPVRRTDVIMCIVPIGSGFDTAEKVRNVFFVLLAAAVFVLKRQYVGPLDEIVHAYAGNLSISFAVYFLFANLQFPLRFKSLLAAAIAFAVVELFEALDGFGVMLNTYDPIDFLVNAVGIALGLWLDTTLAARKTKRLKPQGS
jgi:hypothetical protein